MFLLRKMTAVHSTPIQYYLEDTLINDFLGKKFSLHWSGKIHCIQCDRDIKKSFQQGYCYPCFQKIHECNNCMIHPERCLVEQGKCNPDAWAHAQCHQKHLVYLANTSGLKVGITRSKNNPARWIDQGAVQALPIIETVNRYQAGLIEVDLRKFMDDKTNWRKMLQGEALPLDLEVAKKEALRCLGTLSERQALLSASTLAFTYPVLRYPEKLNMLSFDKTPSITGTLLGIKGQYLMLDAGVFNVRKFGGYMTEWYSR